MCSISINNPVFISFHYEDLTAMRALTDAPCWYLVQTITDEGKDTVFISHGDCLEDARALASVIKERIGTQTIHINNVGPVIGAHTGPGVVALFYMGTGRRP